MTTAEVQTDATDRGERKLNLRVYNTLGKQPVKEQVDPETWTETLVQSMAAKMALPLNVPYAFRDDSTGQYLDNDKPIGSQVAEDEEAHLMVTPKSHLG